MLNLCKIGKVPYFRYFSILPAKNEKKTEKNRTAEAACPFMSSLFYRN